jgi:alkylation response protein AidB-like acyl-CoA dehydrogenase
MVWTMTNSPMSPAELIEAAEKLAPLLREKARESELARRPLDEVIEAARRSGLFALMTPRVYGGHEADLDTFFEVSLTLSRADTSMGWLLGFYIEHNFWFCGFPETFQTELFANSNHILAPATLNAGAGTATKVEGGYRLDGQWQWGTGIIHADWVMAGAITSEGDGPAMPVFFVLPREDVEAVDTWHVLGMCGTGSWDMRIDDVFVPEEQVVSMLDLVNAIGESSRLHPGDLYRTPLIPVLGFAAATPMLGAAQMSLEEYQTQTKAKIASAIEAVGGEARTIGKPSVVARAALNIDAAEMILRDVLADVMTQRNQASMETRSSWLSRISHAVFMCREAVQDINSVTGASGAFLESPVQRALRDITTGSNHIIFDREMRYADYGRILLDQPIQNLLV